MTTKEAIKTLISADYSLSYAIGYAANKKEFDSNVFDALATARNKLEEVALALCDELPDQKIFIGDSRAELGLQDPDHIAGPGKMMYGGQPVNLCAKEDS